MTHFESYFFWPESDGYKTLLKLIFLFSDNMMELALTGKNIFSDNRA